MGQKSKKIGLVTIADGNSKLGVLPAISLIPGRDCGNCEVCIKSCYALKAWRQYPGTRAAWERNSTAARDHRQQYFTDIGAYLTKYRPAYFRWHVAGDILDQDYFERMMRLARQHPATRFLAFTKMYGLDFRGRPRNLTIVLSMWPGLRNPTKSLPRAWYQDGTETRVPESAIHCPGNCETCGMCWDLPRIGRDVVFFRH
jgi:ferredoxin